MKSKLNHFITVLFYLMPILAFHPLQAQSESNPTKVLVRAISRDAKVIGTKVGGARITIREFKTGNILAEGIQLGGTGSTARIMKEARVRGEKVYDTPGTAGFLASLELIRPTVIEITAEGPLDTPQSIYKASKTLLVVPGQDILGEGVLLEIHGFRMNLLEPGEDIQPEVGEELEVWLNMTMT